MIEWRQVADEPGQLRIYRIDAESTNTFRLGGSFDPLETVLAASDTREGRRVREDFRSSEGPVGPSSFRVACHVVSLPDQVLVIDSTFGTTAPQVFPGTLEEILAHEGGRIGDRPLRLLYTHAHFDHAGGHAAVEELESELETIAHPYTGALQPWVSRRDSFFATKGWFFRDCGVEGSVEQIREELRALYQKMMVSAGQDPNAHPFGSASDAAIRIDREIEPTAEQSYSLDERVEILRFDGHIPGHLCVRVDRIHLITGDMWLPATTSTVTPGAIASLAGVPPEECGIQRYIHSSERLLDFDVDACISYPSHEVIFRNPKRMAMRDLELFAERFGLLYRVLAEHERSPMRVVDLAWGGAQGLPLWKVNGSKQRLMLAHDEAQAHVQDLVRVGDLEEIEPERYVWTGRSRLRDRLQASLEAARENYGHLEFRSRR